jgi:hypothetical protein
LHRQRLNDEFKRGSGGGGGGGDLLSTGWIDRSFCSGRPNGDYCHSFVYWHSLIALHQLFRRYER